MKIFKSSSDNRIINTLNKLKSKFILESNRSHTFQINTIKINEHNLLSK